MNRDIKHLNMKVIPLSEGVDPPAERLPDPEPIFVTKEEYNKMMESWINVKVEIDRPFDLEKLEHTKMTDSIA